MTADESYDDASGSAALLPVPAASVAVFRDRCPAAAGMDDAEVMDLCEAVGLPMVAAELRRLVRVALHRNDLSVTDLYDRIHDIEEGQP